VGKAIEGESSAEHCPICWGIEEDNSCICHMYEWGECINPVTHEKYQSGKAWFLQGHVGDPDFYASL
jgi:hypothetical protein